MNKQWRIAAAVITWIALAGGAHGGKIEEVLEKSGVQWEKQGPLENRGICVVLGDKACSLAIALADASDLVIDVPLSDPKDVEAARRAAYAAGRLGTRIFVEKQVPGRIGLADDVADLVVARGDASGAATGEVQRVLRPAGQALVGGQTWSKPFSAGVDEWSHHYHGPNNNPQSRDQLARAPYLTQFIAEPRYAPAPQAAVASGGRVFMAFGHVAWHEREERVLNTLVAVNGFNGTTLWKRPLVQGIMVDRSTMIATPSTLYLADDKSCKLLDAATGAVRDEIIPPVEKTGGTFWKWMAMEGGVLYALVGPDEPKDPNAKWRSANHGWPWDGISKGYNVADYRWGFAKTLLAIDPKTKQVLWTHAEDPAIDSRSVCMTGGRMYFASFGRYIVCLDAKDGREIWRRTAEKDREVFRAIGPYRPGHGYIGGWKSTVYLKCTDKALYFVGPQVEWVTALATEDGHVLFKHPAKDLHVVVRDDGVYTIGAQNSKDNTKKLDSLSGAILAEYNTCRRACTRSTGTPDGIFFRGHEGSGRLDMATGQVQWVSAMRPSCNVGVVVAHGRLYWLPWVCDCNLQMFGAISLAPAGNFKFDKPATEADRLEQSADNSELARLPQSPADWPTYRADNARRARSAAVVPDSVEQIWQTPPKTGIDATAPVAAGGLVFVSGTDGVVQAINASSGRPAWTAFTGGAVRYPPSIADGRAFVGSSDGWAYCFEAATGRLLWRFRAAPIERKIPIYGSLLSTWPVAGGVVVEGGVVYFAAGLNDIDGTHVYALDAATGKIRWQNNTAGHLDTFSKRGVTCQGEMLVADGKLFLAGGNTVSPGMFDLASGKCLNSPPTGMGSHAPRGRELRVEGGQVKVSGQPLYSRPGFPVFDASCQWTEAVVTAKNAQLVCREQKEDGKSAWLLVARDPSSKKDLWTKPLSAEPVRWGVAVDAQGRILVTLRNGQVVCFGKGGAK